MLAGESNKNQIHPVYTKQHVDVFWPCARFLLHCWNHVCILCVPVLVLLLLYAASLVLLALLVGFAAGVACADGCWCWLLVLVHVLLALLVLVHVLVVSGGVACFAGSGSAGACAAGVACFAGAGSAGAWAAAVACFAGAAGGCFCWRCSQTTNDTSSSRNPNML